MKNNVITHESMNGYFSKNNVVNVNALHAIQIQEGWLSILGKTQEYVTFVACGLEFKAPIEPHVTEFSKNVIATRDLKGADRTIIFEYPLRGEIRNSQKLLQSVRNKFMRAIRLAEHHYKTLGGD